jgi:hypothetical protein
MSATPDQRESVKNTAQQMHQQFQNVFANIWSQPKPSLKNLKCAHRELSIIQSNRTPESLSHIGCQGDNHSFAGDMTQHQLENQQLQSLKERIDAFSITPPHSPRSVAYDPFKLALPYLSFQELAQVALVNTAWRQSGRTEISRRLPLFHVACLVGLNRWRQCIEKEASSINASRPIGQMILDMPVPRTLQDYYLNLNTLAKRILATFKESNTPDVLIRITDNFKRSPECSSAFNLILNRCIKLEENIGGEQ